MREQRIAVVKDIEVLVRGEGTAREVIVRDPYNRREPAFTPDQAYAFADAIRDGARIVAEPTTPKGKKK